MAYTPSDFNYNLKSFDIEELSASAADIYNMRDTELQNYLKQETASIQSETGALSTSITNLQTQINGMLGSDKIRFGSAVVTCPAVGGTVNIVYASHGSSSFLTSWGTYSIFVMNGDHQTNPGRFQVWSPNNNTKTQFTAVHWGGGTVGSLVRINFLAFGY
jgi:hypothetical protein